MVSAIFHLLVRDFSVLALTTAALSGLTEIERKTLARMIIVPQPLGTDRDFVAERARR